jgi:aminoglycoside phosphotransferase
VDLALVAMEIEDRFGQEWVHPFFRAYGFDFHFPDQQKLRFYYDLYELF